MMNIKQIIGIILLTTGILYLLCGINNTLTPQQFIFSFQHLIHKPSIHTGHMIIGGSIIAFIGLVLLITQWKKSFVIQTNIARLLHAILSGIALAAFLFFPIVSLGGRNTGFSGIELLSKSNSWEYDLLFYILLIISIGNVLLGIIPITKKGIEEQRRDRIYATSMMFYPLIGIYLLLKENPFLGIRLWSHHLYPFRYNNDDMQLPF